MNYAEARVYLDEMSKYGSVLGLESIKELLGRLGNPQDSLKFIHISGTNGKGSVLAFLSTILSGAGYRTGRYISPTLFSYRERIQVDGEYIERDALARHVTSIAAAAADMDAAGLRVPTAFEIETALAFLYFQEKHCDVVVLETGLGGALDATNIVQTSVLEVITSISMDHIDCLGDTLEKIARQKAGIIKPRTQVASAAQQLEATRVIVQACEDNCCPYRVVDPAQIRDIRYGYESQTFSYKDWQDIEINLAGSYQIQNAALALEAIDALRYIGFRLSDQQVREGMLHTTWRGRFTLLCRDPVVIMDGAHNPEAAQELKQSLELYFKGKKLHYILGMFRDKDIHQVIALTAPLAADIITIQTPNSTRALPAEDLREAVARVNPRVEAMDSIAEAVKTALDRAGRDDVIVIFGSLSFLGEAEQAVLRERSSHEP